MPANRSTDDPDRSRPSREAGGGDRLEAASTQGLVSPGDWIYVPPDSDLDFFCLGATGG